MLHKGRQSLHGLHVPQTGHPTWGVGFRKGQYISNKRPSRFVILSGAKDLCPARDPSLRSG